MAGTVWNTFSPGTVAKSSEVNANFDWLEGDILPMSGGTKASATYDIGSVTFKWRDGWFSRKVYSENGELPFPSGTKMLFYQASAPTGWTAVSLNDKFIRVVTAGGTGGSTGGTMAASTSLAHSHTVNAHTHDLSNHTHSIPNHVHNISVGGPTNLSYVTTTASKIVRDPADGSVWLANGSAGSSSQIFNRTDSDGGTGTTSGVPSNNTSGGASNSGTDTIFTGAFAYADVIVASKD